MSGVSWKPRYFLLRIELEANHPFYQVMWKCTTSLHKLYMNTGALYMAGIPFCVQNYNLCTDGTFTQS